MAEKKGLVVTTKTLGIIIIIIIAVSSIATYMLFGRPREAKEEIGELRLWHTYSPFEEEVAKNLLDEFEKEHPNIKITMEMIPYGELRSKLITAIAAGQAPDLVRMDIIWVPEYAEMGALLDLDNYIAKAGISANDFYAGPWSTCIWEGTTYGLPLDTNTRVLVYRKDLFNAAGVMVPKTWDEFVEVAKKLTLDKDGDGLIDQWGWVIQDSGIGSWQFDPFLWQAGGDVLNPKKTSCIINEEPGVKALEFLVDLIYKYKVCPSSLDLWKDQWGMFVRGEVAMIHDGPWVKGIIESMNPDVLDQMGLAVKPKGVEEASVIGGEDLVSFKQTKFPDAAWEVMRYMTSKHFQLEMGKVGQIPVLKAAGGDPVLKDDPFWKVFLEQMRTAKARPVHPQFSKMDEIIHRHLEAALLGEEPPKAVLDAIANEINELLKA